MLRGSSLYVCVCLHHMTFLRGRDLQPSARNPSLYIWMRYHMQESLHVDLPYTLDHILHHNTLVGGRSFSLTINPHLASKAGIQYGNDHCKQLAIPLFTQAFGTSITLSE
ncbi:hypothetical protein O6H91_18G077500 [Diphasiastrum complanatum]|uniref:Uncharacterized protein n=1 Tax=Diphasiastrum complanatum TaxID=34168 RepID=A0ACC2B2U2_DIPCM|nr:hypothetical protein O6H91_18G077500 [Diphasiastrum complanatum]